MEGSDVGSTVGWEVVGCLVVGSDVVGEMVVGGAVVGDCVVGASVDSVVGAVVGDFVGAELLGEKLASSIGSPQLTQGSRTASATKCILVAFTAQIIRYFRNALVPSLRKIIIASLRGSYGLAL